MGLDILAFEKVTLTEEHPTEDEDGEYCGDRDNHYYITGGRLGGLQAQRCYDTSGQEMHFRAGSYSGYSEWRNALSEVAVGVPADRAWNEPQKYSICPFYELIDFSDCEGVIGPSVAHKLARDFRIQRETVRPRLEDKGEWYAEQYDLWQNAFALAAGEGMVYFC